MKYIKLSSDSSCFTAKKHDKYLILSWFSTLDLSTINTVGLNNLQISPLVPNTESDYVIIVYCNLIKPTELNPRGELACIRIPKKHNTIPSQLHLGNTS